MILVLGGEKKGGNLNVSEDNHLKAFFGNKGRRTVRYFHYSVWFNSFSLRTSSVKTSHTKKPKQRERGEEKKNEQK